ncbi:MAG: GNAT family N-acetyltransferase [Chloroflexota bacterium]|nr:GNAT family N-acetyltransferase [Chloroflexota bacterium]
MQDYPRDRFPALLARLEARPWHTAARFLLRSGGARVMVDDVARPHAAAVMMPASSLGGAYLIPLGDAEPLLDFLAEEPGISRLWASDAETERLISGTLFGDQRTDITILAATDDWRLPPRERTSVRTRSLGPPDAEAVTRLLRGEGEWLTDAFGSIAALLAEGLADGVEEDGRLVAIAATWAIATPYAEVGAHTDRSARGKGYATACAHSLMTAVAAKGLLPQWTAFTDNVTSLGLAQLLGLVPVDTGVEYRRDE